MAGFSIHFSFMSAQGGGAAAPDCTLRVENFEVTQTRNPSIVPLPQQNADSRGIAGPGGTGAPTNLALDFGLMQEQIRLSGKITDEDRSDIGPLPQSIALFLSRMRTHWVESPTVITQASIASQVGLIKISAQLQETDGVTVWYCTPMRNTWRRAGGNPWWEYDITLGVVFYPTIPIGF